MVYTNMMKHIHFIAAPHDKAQSALIELTQTYGQCDINKADVIVPLGGDGTLLETLSKDITQNVPVFGMNKGSVGFLMNPYRPEDLIERINKAQSYEIHPLRMRATTADGQTVEGVAFNEVAVFRATHHAAKISIYVDEHQRMAELIADGVMVASPAGSTAYNFSAHGPILPLGANLLALTPISPFRPRRWRGALLPQHHEIRFKVNDPENRPVNATADSIEVKNVVEVAIWQSKRIQRHLLFDPEQNLEERIISEQFII